MCRRKQRTYVNDKTRGNEKRMHTHNSLITVRQRRQADRSSILTVQWEGIQSQNSSEKVIKGFRVEYRAEGSHDWIQHAGLIPYRGSFYQYRCFTVEKSFELSVIVVQSDHQRPAGWRSLLRAHSCHRH